jgi:pyruvate dehydrogenase E1 component
LILEDGLQAILQKQEDVFYYLTVMNEDYVHAAMPKGAEGGILRGMYLIRPSSLVGSGATAKHPRKNGNPVEQKPSPRVQLLGSGTILRETLAAAEILEQDWNIAADVWSVTSFTELRRSGLEAERSNRLRLKKELELSWVEQCLSPTNGPVIAATDYVRAVPDLIRTWVPRRYVTLGTDGFGRSDTRAGLRQFFEVDRISIALAAVNALVRENAIDTTIEYSVLEHYGYRPRSRPPWADFSNLDRT